MKVAVVGATGVVGETIVRVLHERRLPIERLGLFASRARAGVEETSDEGLASFDAVFFAGSEEASERYAPPIVSRGGVVLDNSSTFRLRENVPLIVPEVNAHTLRDGDRLFPIGNCTAILLCVALAPVRDAAGLARVNVATYQAVSGAGRAALEEFDRGEGRVARNVIPQIGSFDSERYTGEETKVRDETRKVLDLPGLPIYAACARVPVRTAHAEAVFFETERAATLDTLAEALANAAGIEYHSEGIVTPRDVEGSDLVHVARLRACEPGGRHFQMWIAGDQLRKGAATNGVQILELLLQRGTLA